MPEQAVWRAPGRVNLIGEHTDYNAGFALPFALAVGCTATARRLDAGDAHEVRSAQRPVPVRAPVAGLRPGVSGWGGYVLGVLWALAERGVDVPALAITVDSDVPPGAGLSSSAALVCAVARAVDELVGLGLTCDELLAVTRSAENDFVGAPTGGMDQLAALRCTAGHALFCDMRSLATEQVPMRLDDHVLLVVDTRAEHRHADGEYRRRRTACERAARELGVPALRDVAVDALPEALGRLGDDELRRCTRHVVTENDRVLQSVAALRRGDLVTLGELLNASHASMRDDFRITGPELDLAAATLRGAGALGARLTGGGFGGCVIALLREDDESAAVSEVQRAFGESGFAEPVAFRAQPSAGAHRVET